MFNFGVNAIHHTDKSSSNFPFTPGASLMFRGLFHFLFVEDLYFYSSSCFSSLSMNVTMKAYASLSIISGA